MKLGIIRKPTEDYFIDAKRRGLEFLEFCINITEDHENFLADIENLKEYSRKYGVAIGSVGRWGASKIDADGSIIEEQYEICTRLVDAAKELGSPIFVTGCNYVESLSYYENISAAIKFFTRLLAYGKERGIMIATPNCHWNNYVHSDPTWELIHGYLKDLKIKFDPSHSVYGGDDPFDQIKKWHDRIVHIHLKGSVVVNGERFDDPPAGLDQFNWQQFFGMLYSVGYNGTLSIEPHSKNKNSGKKEDIEMAERGIDYTQRYISQFLI